MLFTRSGRIFFSATKFFGRSGRIILIRVGNTDLRGLVGNGQAQASNQLCGVDRVVTLVSNRLGRQSIVSTQAKGELGSF